MRKTVGYIPRNLGGGTVWDGRIKIRNAIEAIVVCVIVYIITKFLSLFLPYLAVVSIRVICWFLFGGLAAVGVGGEPVSIYLLDIVNYSNTRTYVTLKPPQREIQTDEEEQKKSFIDKLFTGPRRRRNTKYEE